MAKRKKVSYTKVNWDELLADYQSGDPVLIKAAKETACLAMKGFIVSLMKKKYPTYINKEADDLIQAGYTAVIAHLKNYNPLKGKPTTFFRCYIEQEMMNWLNVSRNESTIYYQTINNKIQIAIRFFESNGLPWNDIKISEYMNLPLSTVKNTRAVFNKSATLELKEEIKLGGSDEVITPEASGSPEEDCLAIERHEALYDCISKHLTNIEKEVIFYSFGCCGYPALSQFEIAERLNITGNDVRRIYSQATRKLFQSELGNLVKDRYENSEYLLDDEIAFFPSSKNELQEPELCFTDVPVETQQIPVY